VRHDARWGCDLNKHSTGEGETERSKINLKLEQARAGAERQNILKIDLEEEKKVNSIWISKFFLLARFTWRRKVFFLSKSRNDRWIMSSFWFIHPHPRFASSSPAKCKSRKGKFSIFDHHRWVRGSVVSWRLFRCHSTLIPAHFINGFYNEIGETVQVKIVWWCQRLIGKYWDADWMESGWAMRVLLAGAGWMLVAKVSFISFRQKKGIDNGDDDEQRWEEGEREGR
jgi:hypothetical protein